jgi:hypothetical protein
MYFTIPTLQNYADALINLARRCIVNGGHGCVLFHIIILLTMKSGIRALHAWPRPKPSDTRHICLNIRLVMRETTGRYVLFEVIDRLHICIMNKRLSIHRIRHGTRDRA